MTRGQKQKWVDNDGLGCYVVPSQCFLGFSGVIDGTVFVIVRVTSGDEQNDGPSHDKVTITEKQKWSQMKGVNSDSLCSSEV